MGKFNGVLLATDYDETLYNEHNGITPANREAVSYFIAGGGLFTVSTGRSLRNFSIQLARESLPLNAPAILSNGANIYDFQAGRMLFEELLPARVRPDLERLCNALPTIGFEAYCREEVYVHNANSVTERHLSRAGLAGIALPIAQMPLPWTKAILQHEQKDQLLEAQRFLLKNHSDAYEAILSNANLLELTAKGCHKGSAVLRLAKHLGIARAHIYCIGNGQNDLPMLGVSAEAFAPSNCVPIVRESGATILNSCHEGCIARLIETLDKRYPQT